MIWGRGPDLLALSSINRGSSGTGRFVSQKQHTKYDFLLTIVVVRSWLGPAHQSEGELAFHHSAQNGVSTS